ncbi:MAG: CHASE2 domain-containing protein [Symploca sp. SIO2E9]|nr:CHASE2 domain-containing protein [Symploca sp. SIO2E9]
MFTTVISRKLKQFAQQKHPLLTSVGVTLALILLRFLGILQSSEFAALDLLFRLRTPEVVDERIVIVGIDETDIDKVGQLPISDQVITQLLKKLDSYQPRAIGLDIYRFQPVAPGQEELAKAVETIPNLIGIEQLGDNTNLGVPTLPVLRQHQQVGFNNVVIDTDGRVRRSLLYWHADGKAYKSFALKLALIYLRSEGTTAKPATVNRDYLQLGKGIFKDLKSWDGGYVKADTKGYQVLVNFRPPGSFRTISMREVLQGEIPPTLLRDRIVIIGSTAASFKDFFYTPYSNGLLAAAQPIFGVELQANFISQILGSALDGRPLLKVWSELMEWLWIASWSTLGAFLFWRVRRLKSAFGLLLLASVSLFGSCYLAFAMGWWLPLIPPLLGLLCSTAIITSQVIVTLLQDIQEYQQLQEELRQQTAALSRSNLELQHSQNRLSHLVDHDTLTGLANRKKFHERLNYYLNCVRSHNQLLALMFLDLDGFKQVNDTLGHDTGDQLLRVVAQRLTNSLRESDLVSRLGGDEFTVILPMIPQVEYAAKVADKILKSLSQVFLLEGTEIVVTVSIGISIYPLDGKEQEILIKKADAAMYQSKQLGRNQYFFSSSI